MIFWIDWRAKELQQVWRAMGNSKGPQWSTQEQKRITESCREQLRAEDRKVPITVKHARIGVLESYKELWRAMESYGELWTSYNDIFSNSFLGKSLIFHAIGQCNEITRNMIKIVSPYKHFFVFGQTLLMKIISTWPYHMTIKIVVSELLNSHNDDSFTFHEKAILMIYSPWMILANGQMPMNQAKKDQTTTQKTLLNRARLTLPCCTRPMSENLENSFITLYSWYFCQLQWSHVDYLISIILKRMLTMRVTV